MRQYQFNCKDYREMNNLKIVARVKYFKEESEEMTKICKTMHLI